MELEEHQLRVDRDEYKKKYFNETGRVWLHTYPRPSPILFMYPCLEIGDKYHIISNYTYYHCYPELI